MKDLRIDFRKYSVGEFVGWSGEMYITYPKLIFTETFYQDFVVATENHFVLNLEKITT